MLTRRNRAHLAQAVAADGLLAFDFDGTLAPIVTSPAAATMRSTTRLLLAAISELRKVVIITGRSVADVTPRLHGVRTAAIVGNHGIEPSVEMAAAQREVARWRPILDAAIGHLAGVYLEDKGLTVAVHYRHAPSIADVRAAVQGVCRELGDTVRVVEGIEVMNLIPAGAPNKGDALHRVQALLSARAVLYVGDEETDEDAFAALDQARAVGVRIGRAPQSRAPFYLPSQDDMDTMLQYLLSVLARPTARPTVRAALAATADHTRD